MQKIILPVDELDILEKIRTNLNVSYSNNIWGDKGTKLRSLNDLVLKSVKEKQQTEQLIHKRRTFGKELFF